MSGVPDWQYSDEEIRAMYRQAADKKAQIKILSHLALYPVRKIEEIVGAAKEETYMDKPEKKTIDWSAVELLLENGEPVAEVAKRFDTTVQTINRALAARKTHAKRKANLAAAVQAAAQPEGDEIKRIELAAKLLRAGDTAEVRDAGAALIVALAGQFAARGTGEK